MLEQRGALDRTVLNLNANKPKPVFNPGAFSDSEIEMMRRICDILRQFDFVTNIVSF